MLSISTNTITMDTPLNFAYTAKAEGGTRRIKDLSTSDGSATPVIYNLTTTSAQNLHVTRLLLHMSHSAAGSDDKFGSISALTRGLVFRKLLSDGSFHNYWNVKTNGDMRGIAFDLAYSDKAGPSLFGTSMRWTTGGINTHGAVIEITSNNEMQIVVQDDLTGLESLEIDIGGHVSND